MSSMPSSPPVPQVVWEWLARLHTLTAGSSSADEAEARIGLVAPLIAGRFNADEFNRGSLEHVAAGCKFWPAYGELVALMREWRDLRDPGRALRLGRPETPRIAEDWTPPTEEEKAYVTNLLAGHFQELAARRQAEPPLRPLPDVTLKGEALARFRGARVETRSVCDGSAGAAEPIETTETTGTK